MSLPVPRSVGHSVSLSKVSTRVGSYTSMLLSEHLLILSFVRGTGNIIQEGGRVHLCGGHRGWDGLLGYNTGLVWFGSPGYNIGLEIVKS